MLDKKTNKDSIFMSLPRTDLDRITQAECEYGVIAAKWIKSSNIEGAGKILSKLSRESIIADPDEFIFELKGAGDD